MINNDTIYLDGIKEVTIEAWKFRWFKIYTMVYICETYLQ